MPAAGTDPASAVCETAILPLNYAGVYLCCHLLGLSILHLASFAQRHPGALIPASVLNLDDLDEESASTAADTVRMCSATVPALEAGSAPGPAFFLDRHIALFPDAPVMPAVVPAIRRLRLLAGRRVLEPVGSFEIEFEAFAVKAILPVIATLQDADPRFLHVVIDAAGIESRSVGPPIVLKPTHPGVERAPTPLSAALLLDEHACPL